MEFNDNRNQWLLEGDPWVRWRTYKELLNPPADDPNLSIIHQEVITHTKISHLFSLLEDWPNPLLNSHKASQHPLHILSFLVDIGITVDDPGMSALVEKIFAHQGDQGPFQMKMNISPHYGGKGVDEFAWAICDAPLTLYSLGKLLGPQDHHIKSAIGYLVSLIRENGWPCAVSPELGRWRGPGRKDDPCPFANLVMLKLLAELPEYSDCQAAHIGAETLLSLWENSLSEHPYIFYMGKDFRKLKVPLVWYDILHVTDVLSRFTWLRNDPRLDEMIAVITGKADQSGFYIPESIYMPWKTWEFGQKKEPSRYLTLRVLELLQRMQKN
ncbi:MAG: hypothetical protein MUO40_01850 [Anaerolineaceae bacterium]|nr:hypothetical protein [Anaerolineaceae bacterium]